MRKTWNTLTALLLALALLTTWTSAGEFSTASDGSDAAALAAVDEAVCASEAESVGAVETESVGDLEAEAEPESAPDAQSQEATEVALSAQAETDILEKCTVHAVSAAAKAITPQTSTVQLGLTVVPPYGSALTVQGMVYAPDGGSIHPEDYRVTLYVQLSENDVYWVKPYEKKPFAEINEDGSFSLEYRTGGYDSTAKLLHVLLIPADFKPALHNFDDAKAHALDYVKVVRDKTGSYTLTPNRTAPAPSPGKPSGLKVSEQKIAVNVGFYTQGQPGDKLSIHQIRSQLVKSAAFADTVRFYSATGEITPAYEEAHKLGLSVIGTAWLSRSSSDNQKEINALIELCNKGLVDVACVGSETLLRGDLTPQQLISCLNEVRAGIKDKSLPVTTADSAAKLMESPNVRNACDLLMPNIYPYWEGVAVEDAMNSFTSTMQNMELCSQGKEILVSETGWPSEGQTKKQAVPGEAQAAAYFNAVRDWSRATGTVVLWFDAADEPWKKSAEGEAGAHWGLMTSDLTLKEGFRSTPFFEVITLPEVPEPLVAPTLQSVKNDRNGVTVRWKKVSGAVRYEVCCKSGNDWKTVGSTGSASLTVKTGTASLKSGKSYSFAVRAVGAETESPLSSGKTVVYVAAPVWSGVKYNKKGFLLASWKKLSGVSGYQIQYTTGKNYSAGAKTVTIPKASSASRRITGLKRGKTCKLRLRSYKSVSGKRVWSAWSSDKTVRIM